MDLLKKVIGEAHRRSIWQVLSVYMVGSWVALQVVEVITESAGLPDWAQPFALILLILGLPMVVATAIVQEGVSGKGDPSPEGAPVRSRAAVEPEEPPIGHAPAPEGFDGDSKSGSVRRRLFTWKNAVAGGVAAFAFLGIAVAGYFVMWSTGVGPVGSLAAQGVFEEGDAVVLAQFENTSDDQSLGDMVTEALRVDLAGSSIMTLVEPGRVEDALLRMGRTGEEAVDAELAREVAIRDGFKAIIHGTVGSAGSGYLFVASMQAAESGQVLATFREAARGPDGVIDAIDKLSQDIREKAGESLRKIKAEEPLEDVTTSSLEALKRYVEAERLSDQAEYPRALAALEEAIELDPAFAMAYRRLAVVLQNSGGSLSGQVDAATKAYELRDRLTERERFLAIAYYHKMATLDVGSEIRAYETILERYPDDRTALNNISIALVQKARLPEAVAALERAVNGPGASASALINLPGYLAQSGRHAEAEEAFARFQSSYGGQELWEGWIRIQLASFRGDADATRAAGADFLELPVAQGGWRAAGHMASLIGAAMAGELQEAQAHAETGVQDMRDHGDLSQVLFLEINSVYLEVLAGREAAAARAYSQVDVLGTLDSLPPAARDYPGVLRILSFLGKEEEVGRILQSWEAVGIPSSSSPVFEESRNAAEAVLNGRNDPAQGLEGLNDLARELDCQGCYVWARARFAEDAGRWAEARDLFLAALEGESDDFIGEPLQRVLAHERLGTAYEALGEPAKAAEHYRIFADAWAEADEDLQPRVDAVRAKATSLGGN